MTDEAGSAGAARPRRIAVATCDALTPKMAGPGIRALQIAGALSAEHDVQLVTTSLAGVTDPRFPVRSVDDRSLREIEQWCDVLVFQGWLVTGRPFLLSSDTASGRTERAHGAGGGGGGGGGSGTTIFSARGC